MSAEATVTINGVTLSNGQAMAVRVAISQFFSEMSADPMACGEDDHGIAMTRLYKENCGAVLALMAKVP